MRGGRSGWAAWVLVVLLLGNDAVQCSNVIDEANGRREVLSRVRAAFAGPDNANQPPDGAQPPEPLSVATAGTGAAEVQGGGDGEVARGSVVQRVLEAMKHVGNNATPEEGEDGGGPTTGLRPSLWPLLRTLSSLAHNTTLLTSLTTTLTHPAPSLAQFLASLESESSPLAVPAPLRRVVAGLLALHARTGVDAGEVLFYVLGGVMVLVGGLCIWYLVEEVRQPVTNFNRRLSYVALVVFSWAIAAIFFYVAARSSTNLSSIDGAKSDLKAVLSTLLSVDGLLFILVAVSWVLQGVRKGWGQVRTRWRIIMLLFLGARVIALSVTLGMLDALKDLRSVEADQVQVLQKVLVVVCLAYAVTTIIMVTWWVMEDSIGSKIGLWWSLFLLISVFAGGVGHMIGGLKGYFVGMGAGVMITFFGHALLEVVMYRHARAMVDVEESEELSDNIVDLSSDLRGTHRVDTRRVPLFVTRVVNREADAGKRTKPTETESVAISDASEIEMSDEYESKLRNDDMGDIIQHRPMRKTNVRTVFRSPTIEEEEIERMRVKDVQRAGAGYHFLVLMTSMAMVFLVFLGYVVIQFPLDQQVHSELVPWLLSVGMYFSVAAVLFHQTLSDMGLDYSREQRRLPWHSIQASAKGATLTCNLDKMCESPDTTTPNFRACTREVLCSEFRRTKRTICAEKDEARQAVAERAWIDCQVQQASRAVTPSGLGARGVLPSLSAVATAANIVLIAFTLQAWNSGTGSTFFAPISKSNPGWSTATATTFFVLGVGILLFRAVHYQISGAPSFRRKVSAHGMFTTAGYWGVVASAVFTVLPIAGLDQFKLGQDSPWIPREIFKNQVWKYLLTIGLGLMLPPAAKLAFEMSRYGAPATFQDSWGRVLLLDTRMQSPAPPPDLDCTAIRTKLTRLPLFLTLQAMEEVFDIKLNTPAFSVRKPDDIPKTSDLRKLMRQVLRGEDTVDDALEKAGDVVTDHTGITVEGEKQKKGEDEAGVEADGVGEGDVGGEVEPERKVKEFFYVPNEDSTQECKGVPQGVVDYLTRCFHFHDKTLRERSVLELPLLDRYYCRGVEMQVGELLLVYLGDRALPDTKEHHSEIVQLSWNEEKYAKDKSIVRSLVRRFEVLVYERFSAPRTLKDEARLGMLSALLVDLNDMEDMQVSKVFDQSCHFRFGITRDTNAPMKLPALRASVASHTTQVLKWASPSLTEHSGDISFVDYVNSMITGISPRFCTAPKLIKDRLRINVTPTAMRQARDVDFLYPLAQLFIAVGQFTYVLGFDEDSLKPPTP